MEAIMLTTIVSTTFLEVVAKAHVKRTGDKKKDYDSGENQVAHMSIEQ
jgi:hypothetical protein